MPEKDTTGQTLKEFSSSDMKSNRHISLKTLVVIVMSAVMTLSMPCESLFAAKPSKTTQSKTTQSKTTQSKKNTNKVRSKTPKTSAEAKRLQEEAQKDIRQTKEKIRLNDQEIKEGLADLNQLSSEIKTGRAKVSDLQRKVASLEREITTLNGDIARNEKELHQMREEYLKAVKKMRLNRKNQSMLAFIFASDDFNQAMRRWRYLRQFSKWKERKSYEIDEKIMVLGKEKEQLAQAKESHTVSLDQLSATQKDLEAKHQRQSKLVDGLKQNGAALQAHLSQKQNEANQLKNAIASLIAQEQAKAEAERRAREKAEAERIAREKAEAERIAREKAEAERLAQEKAEAERLDKENADAKAKADKKKKKEEAKRKKEQEKKKKASEKKSRNKKSKNRDEAKPVAAEKPKESVKPNVSVAGASNFASMRGRLPRPVDGGWRITNPFGRHSMPELPEVVYDNPGIDAEVAKGTTVKAVCAGRVSGVYKLPGYGTVVIVNHGEYYTVYGNLASVSVSVGSQLSAGSSIGSAAADPDDQRRGSVHFEIWHGREKQNPEAWFR